MSAHSPAVPVAAPPQLSPEHHRQLAVARKAVRKLRRTISVASFDGWTVAVFAALTMLTSITDPSGLFMGLGMAAVAYVELQSVGRLRQLDTRATRTLALNQVALASILTLYALWRLHTVMTGPSPYEAYKSADPQIARMLQPVENITHLVSLALYGAMIVVAFFAQGGLAIFYFTRGKHIDAYLAQTPRWIIEMQKSGVAL